MSKPSEGSFRIAVALAAGLAWGGAAWTEDRVPVALTLHECIGIALENNLDLKIETLSRDSARREVDIALGGYDPNFIVSVTRAHEETAGGIEGTSAGVLDVTGARTDRDAWNVSLGGATPLGGLGYEVGTKLGQSSGMRAGGNPFDMSSGSVGITLTQPLLKGFRTDDTRYRVALARKQSAEAAAQLEDRLQSTLAQVEAAWYALIQTRESLRVQEDAVRLATQLFEDNRRRVRIGSMSNLDEKQAESQAASARADLSSARLAYVEAQNRLKTLMYADHRNARGLEIDPAGDMAADPIVVDADAIASRALDNRPDLRQARLALARQGIIVGYHRNQKLPSLNLVGGYGLAASSEDSYGRAVDRIGSADEPFWTAGVTFSVPLGNRVARHRYAQSLDAEEILRLQFRQAEENALVEVDNAVASVVTGLDRVQSTREARIYAEEALSAEQRKLESGKTTSFVVLQLQRDLTQARQAEIRALADYNQRISALSLAEGAILGRLRVDFSED